MGDTISLKKVMTSIKQRILLIMGFVIAAGALGWAYTEYIATPAYQSSTEIIITQGMEKIEKGEERLPQIADVQASLDLINTYKAIIFSPVVLKDVKEELGLSLSTTELAKNIKVSNEPGSQLLTLQITDSNPQQAAEIANKTVEILQEKTSSLIYLSKLTVLSKAEKSYDNLSPTLFSNISYGILAGLVIGTSVALLVEYLNPAIKSKEDFNKMDIPVLGVISHVSQRDKIEYNAGLRNRTKKGELDVTEKNTV